MRKHCYGHDEQVAEANSSGGARHRPAAAARLFASLQPEELYAAAVVRPPGAERVSAAGLSQAVGVVGRRTVVRCCDRAQERAPVQHVPESGRSIVVGTTRATT